MNRRTFNKLVSFAAMGALADDADLRAESTAPEESDEVTLENEHFLVSFDRGSGALTRLSRKATGWMIQRRPELGASFRLLAPLPERRDNFVLGQKQPAASVEKPSENQVRIRWANLLSEHGGVLPITLIASVTLNGAMLSFEGMLENDSKLTVETIDYPYFGDLNAPTTNATLSSEHMWYGNLVRYELHPRFTNDKGYWGVRYPTATIDTKQSLFCLIQAEQQGLYVEMHDPTQPYLLEFTFVQHPGYLQSVDGIVPESDEISGTPVHLEFRTCHFVFAHAQTRAKLAPVVLKAYDGDWHAGIDEYKQWRSTWFIPRQLPEWVRDIHSWLQLRVDGAEQDYSVPFRTLPRYIDECAENGVTAIQIVGWETGGQDGGDPRLDPEPGLGSWEDLHQAILYARSKGVKIILFGKPIWADLTTDWYKTELFKYQCTDPYGIPYQTQGYSYTTPTQLAGINNRRRAIMDVQSEAYRAIATREVMKTVALGAAGWLFDEVCHHGPVLYSFSPDHGYAPPGYIYGGDVPMARQFRAAADKVDRDFIFAGEGPQDWLMQYYPVAYFRINSGSRPVCRYIDSQAPLVVAVTGFDDREKLNLILLHRYAISYEPYNFKGHLTDFPLTLAYGKKIDALRRRYREYLWDSEFLDTRGVQLIAEAQVRHSVFRAKSGKRAIVLVNMDSKRNHTANVELPNARALVTVSPESPDAVRASSTVEVPARSALVLMEEQEG